MEMETAKPNRSKKSALGATMIVAFLMLLTGVAEAAFYNSSATWDVNLKGQTREFDGPNFTFDAEDGSLAGGNVVNYTVRLYRDNTWPSGDDYIGLKSCPNINVRCMGTWTNVGAGDYYVRLSRANDGGTANIADFDMWD